MSRLQSLAKSGKNNPMYGKRAAPWNKGFFGYHQKINSNIHRLRDFNGRYIPNVT